MQGFQTDPIDLLWLLVVASGVSAFLIFRRPDRTNTSTIVVSVGTIGMGWIIAAAWTYFRFLRSSPDTAFSSVEYMIRDVPNDWWWQYVAYNHGWIFGACALAIALGAARLWPRRSLD